MVYQPEGFDPLAVESFLKTSNATALILTRGEAILFRAGHLSAEGFQRFAEAVTHYWQVSPRGDTNRYMVVRLEDQHHFLFARYLPVKDALVGLVFPLHTPLVHIRQDMVDLMHLLQEFAGDLDGGDARLEQSLQFKEQDMPIPDSAPSNQAVPEGWHVEDNAFEQLKDATVPEDQNPQPRTTHNPTNGEDKSSSSPNIPLPSGSGEASPINSPQNLESTGDELGWQPLDALMPPDSKSDTGDVKGGKSWQPLDKTTPGSDDLASILQDDFEIHRAKRSLEDQGWISASATEAPGKMMDSLQWDGEETKPVSRATEEVPLAESVLDTTFYLVPRQDEHYLLGELAHRLRKWLPRLCEIYGWQLDALSVRPDYVKWTLIDFPECLTRKMLAVVRRWTSERIFKVFPTLQLGNPTQDFWSPGYLVDRQNRDFPTQVWIAHVSRGRAKEEAPDFVF